MTDQPKKPQDTQAPDGNSISVGTDMEKAKICGIVMPIAAMDNCSAEHWSEVYEIISDSADEAGFSSEIVSNGNGMEVIHQKIVQNLFLNDIVVCDVSGKNPNVMLELGMRLAFNKPVIVVKDDETGFSFDTSPIEHLLYPRTLHYQKIQKFKADLTKKIKATYEASLKTNYKSFLSNFGTYEAAALTTETLPHSDIILRKLTEIESKVAVATDPRVKLFSQMMRDKNTICIKGEKTKIDKFSIDVKSKHDLEIIENESISEKHFHLKSDKPVKEKENEIRDIARSHGLKVSWVSDGF